MLIKDLGAQQPYQPIWQAMLDTIQKADLANWQQQIWLLEHTPVYTKGEGSTQQPLLNPYNTPVVSTDRGGDITYHGPGQLMIYCLFNLRRLTINAHELANTLETWVTDYLNSLSIESHTKSNQPGVFIHQSKVCSVGLRIKRGISYHGLAINVDMDLAPFHYINPCGYTDLSMTRLCEHAPHITLQDCKDYFQQHLPQYLASISHSSKK